VGDGSDRWAPPSSEMKRGSALSAATAEGRARLAGRSSVGRESRPRGKERREGEKTGRGGGKGIGPSPRVGRERNKPFLFYFHTFCSILLKGFSKPF